MDVTTDTKTLKTALTLAKKVIPSRNGYLPGLGGIRIEATTDGLSFTTTDIDIMLHQFVEAEVRELGVTLVSLKVLHSLMNGKGPIDLRTDESINNGEIQVVNGVHTSLRAMALEEFPRIPDGEGHVESFPLDLDNLSEVVQAASRDDARPILTGVFFNGTEIVGTDSYRLHLVRSEIEYPKVLLSSRALGIIAAMKKVDSATLETVTNGADVTYRVVAGDTVWDVREIEGEFPNYKQLIPDSYPNSVTIDRNDFIDKIKAVAVMAREAAPVRLSITENELEITAITQDVGQSRGVMPCSLVGQEAMVAFNPDFLLDCASIGRGDKITIKYLDALKPATLSEIHDDGSESLRLIMPARVS